MKKYVVINDFVDKYTKELRYKGDKLGLTGGHFLPIIKRCPSFLRRK